MTLCFGPYLALFVLLRRWVFGHPPTWATWWHHLFFATLGIAVWFSIVTIPLWNRRARRLGSA